MQWWDRCRWALPLIIVTPMLVLAWLLGTHAIIFPEGAALAMGIWVLGLQGWTASRWRVIALPPLFAAAGVLLVQAQLPRTVAEIGGVTIGLLVLAAFDSRLAPALSAAVLPIVFSIDEWGYPAAVLVICLVLAALWRLVRHPATRRLDDAPPRRYPSGVAAVAWVVIVGWVLVGGQLLALPAAVFAPPLFVSVLEWLGRGQLSPADGMRRWGLLVGAAVFGSVTARSIPIAPVAGVVAVCATLALMRLLAVAHPPALAIALIPFLLEAADPGAYVAAIATGSAALYLGAFGVALATPATLRAPLVGSRP
jgi:hypothetical protein